MVDFTTPHVRMTRVAPTDAERAAAALRDAAVAGRRVRLRGGATKLDWGAAPPAAPELELSTERLDAVVAPQAGDLTAGLETRRALARGPQPFPRDRPPLAPDPPPRARRPGAPRRGLPPAP